MHRQMINLEDSQEQYEFKGSSILRTQKSMSLISEKQSKCSGQLKKSKSFLAAKKSTKSTKNLAEPKIGKKCLNITETLKKPEMDSKSSMNKTSGSLRHVSLKSNLKNKKRSVTRDYIILNEEVFECQNIEEVNEKLICKDSDIYNHGRFIKLTMRNQEKLENYLKSFSQYSKYMKKTSIDISKFSTTQKTKLYALLKSQTHSQMKQKSNSLKNPEIEMDSLMRQICMKIQKKSQQMIRQRPELENYVKIWKSEKMHGLMETNEYIQKTKNQQQSSQENTSFEASFQHEKQKQFQENHTNLKIGELKEGYNTQLPSFNNFDLKLQLHQSEQSNFANSKLHSNQAYPQRLIKHEISKALPPTSVLSDFGIETFLQDLWNFIIDEQLDKNLIQSLRESYGLSQEQKKFLMENGSKTGEEWTAYITTKTKQILPNEIFISFSKHEHQSVSPTQSSLQQKSLIFFKKFIFDSMNLQLAKFQRDFPYGVFNELEMNTTHSGYIINEENIMSLWDQCLQNILESNRIGVGSFGEQCEEKKKYEEKAFKQFILSEYEYFEWQRTFPLSRRKIMMELLRQIEREIFIQMAHLL